MIWENSSYLFFFALLPVLFFVFRFAKHRLNKQRLQYFDDKLWSKLLLGDAPVFQKVRSVLLWFGLSFLILAMAGPKVGTQVKEVKRRGVDLMVALDLSASMNAEDIKPSRLDKAKYEIRRMVDQLKGDRVGLVVFTGEAYLQSPMTLDYSAMRLFLNIAETDQMPSSSTNFDAAMQTSLEAFESMEEERAGASRVLLIVSDGEDYGESYESTLKKLNDANISVFTIGMGTSTGGTIPQYNKSGTLLGYKRDNDGRIVTTKLESSTLEKIAEEGKGSYFEVSRGNDGFDGFLQKMEQLEKGEFASQEYADFKNQYQLMVGLALGCFVLALLLPNYKEEEASWNA